MVLGRLLKPCFPSCCCHCPQMEGALQRWGRPRGGKGLDFRVGGKAASRMPCLLGSLAEVPGLGMGCSGRQWMMMPEQPLP